MAEDQIALGDTPAAEHLVGNDIEADCHIGQLLIPTVAGQTGNHMVDLLQHGIQANLIVDVAHIVLAMDQIQFIAHWKYLHVCISLAPRSVPAAWWS